MLCCIRRAKNVEKNEETEQEIKQDQGKAEDNVHKAATKIQASFRGHITRQKMKSEKEEKNQSDPLKPADEDEQKKPVSPAEENPQEVSTEAETKSEPVAEQPDLPSAHPSLSAPAEEDEEVLQEEDPADVPDDTEKKPETQHVESEVSAGEQLSENLDGEKQSV